MGSCAGIWADTVRQRRPVIHNDYQGMEGRQGYPEGHAHLVRHMGVPVIEGDKVHMLLGVGNKSRPYTEADVRDLVTATLARPGAAPARYRALNDVVVQRHESGRMVELETWIGGRFVNDPLGARFELPTSAVDNRYGEASLALTALYRGGWSGYLSYRRLFGVDDTEQQFWSAGLRKEF